MTTRTIRASLALALLATASDQALAQAVAANGGLEEVTVTARRRDEALQDVPLTVTSFSAAQIDRLGIRDIGDVAKYTPGLIIDKGFVPQDVRPNIRGLPATRGRPPIGILLDGIDVSTESIATAGGGLLANLNLVDFERIEVVKGPQSALYGRVAFGGAINYVSKQPSDDYEGYAEFSAATYDRYEVRGAVNVPISDDFAVRINTDHISSQGMYKNTITNNYIGGEESTGVAVAARLKVGDFGKITARVSYSLDQADVRPQYYLGTANGLAVNLPLPASAIGQLVGPGTGNAVLPPFSMGPAFGVLSPQPAIRLSRDPATGGEYPGSTLKPLIFNLHGEFDLGWATLSNWTGYTHANVRQVQDTDFYGYPLQQVSFPAPGGLGELKPNGSSPGLQQFDQSSTIQQVSEEIRLGDFDSKPFRWAVGSLYWYENVDQYLASISSFGLGAGASPYLDVALQGGRAKPQLSGRETKHYSGYALGEVDILENLTFEAEGRYSKESYNYLFGPSVGLSGTGLTGIAPFSYVGTPITATQATYFFTPRFSLTYKPTDDVLVYASISKGVKPAGVSQVANADPSQGRFGTEKLWNYEAGVKTSWFEKRLTLNAAYFHMEYNNKQETTLQPVPLSVSPQGNLSITQNIGSAEVDGFELEGAAVITPELTAQAGYTFLYPRYTDYRVNSTSDLGLAIAGNCTITQTATFRTCIINNTGNLLEQAARHSLNATISYLRPMPMLDSVMGGGWSLLAEVSPIYRSKRFLEDTNKYILDAYVTVDARIGIQNGRYSVFLFGTNIFDDRTVKSAQASGDTQGGIPVRFLIETFAPDKAQFGLRARVDF